MKKLFIISLFSALFLIFAHPSFGAYSFNENSGLKDMGSATQLGESGVVAPEIYIGNILTIFFSFLGLIFFILIIYSGILWMTAQGDTGQVSKAKETIIRAIVGLIISIAAYGITYFVMNIFPNSPKTTDNTQINQ
ncbi:MAG: hypothetical protein WCK59_00230 [Candidatus Falkowbacteria bacterium]